MKTRDLKGRALDYAVALAEGFRPFIHYGVTNHPMPVIGRGSFYPPIPMYVEGPAAGDAIIDRELIDTWHRKGTGWCASIKSPGIGREWHGTTRREAAMRAWVYHKLGDEVEIPEELT